MVALTFFGAFCVEEPVLGLTKVFVVDGLLACFHNAFFIKIVVGENTFRGHYRLLAGLHFSGRVKGVFFGFNGEEWKVFKSSFFAVLSPVIILGCIYSGVASPTEAAVISVFYSLIVSIFIYKSLPIKKVYDVFVEAVRTYAPILFILAASIAFSRVLTLMQVPQLISGWILAHFTSKVVVLIVINLVLLLVGMVMDTTPAILILTPILLPIVEGFGMDPIHFGVMMVVNLAIGFVTPPIGVNLFVASSLTDIPVVDIAKRAMPLIGFFLIALLLITFIPQISLCLL